MKKTFIERTLNRFGLSRIKAKPASQRDFNGASTSRLTEDWMTPMSSADSEVRKDLKRLRNRCRDLERNNDYARRFGKLLENNTIGSKGVSLQMKVKDYVTKAGKTVAQLDTAANGKIEDAWYDWGKIRNCTIAKDSSWLDVQRLTVRRTAFDGAILIRKIKGKAAGNKYNFALQVIEYDHVDHDFEGFVNGNEVRMGVERNADKKVVAYHLLSKHPGDNFYLSKNRLKRTRIPAEEIIHVCIKERPDQTTGVPWLISAMTRLNMLGAYEEAELIAARVAACKEGYIENQAADGYQGDDVDANGNQLDDMSPGKITELGIGKKFVSHDPTHPTNAFPDFVKACLRGISSGLGVTYNGLANDLEGVNFSSIRAGVLEEREEWKMVQNWFIEHVCDEIFPEWLEMALMSGAIALPFSKLEKFNYPEWKARRWDWVDPEKDVRAKILAIQNNLTNHRDTISETGADIEDVFHGRMEDKQLAEGYELILDPETAAKMAAGGQQRADGEVDFENLKQEFDSYGVGVRAGVITPTVEDEAYFRKKAGLPAITKEAKTAWGKEDNVRRPITLTPVGGEKPAFGAAPAPQEDPPVEP